MTDEQYNNIIKKLDEILANKPTVPQGVAANQSGLFHVSIEEPGKGTKNGKWMHFRGKFQQEGRQYPDWVSLFVKTEASGGIRKGDTVAVEGRLKSDKGDNGRLLHSIFAEKVVAQPSITIQDDEDTEFDVPF